MSARAATVLVDLAEAKARRLRLFMWVLAFAGACMVFAANNSWYRFEYTLDTVATEQISTRPTFELDAGAMAAVSAQAATVPSPAAQNPDVGSTIGLPTFVLAPLVGTTVALLGLWLRSAAMSMLGMLGYLYGWFQLSQARWWFEQAPGRDGWRIERGSGQSLFMTALAVSIGTLCAAALQAVFAYRAARKARIAAGEDVEDTAFEMLVKLITRTSSVARPSSVSKPSR